MNRARVVLAFLVLLCVGLRVEAAPQSIVVSCPDMSPPPNYVYFGAIPVTAATSLCYNGSYTAALAVQIVDTSSLGGGGGGGSISAEDEVVIAQNVESLITVVLLIGNVLAWFGGLVIGWRLSVRPVVGMME